MHCSHVNGSAKLPAPWNEVKVRQSVDAPAPEEGRESSNDAASMRNSGDGSDIISMLGLCEGRMRHDLSLAEWLEGDFFVSCLPGTSR